MILALIIGIPCKNELFFPIQCGKPRTAIYSALYKEGGREGKEIGKHIDKQ